MDKTYSTQFFNSLVEAVQKCCHDYLKFEKSVELGGFLFLEIDNNKKERYILSEMVHSTGDVISESYCVRSFHGVNNASPSKKSSGISSEPTDSDLNTECLFSLPNSNTSNPTSISSRCRNSQQNENNSQESLFDKHDTSVDEDSTSSCSKMITSSSFTFDKHDTSVGEASTSSLTVGRPDLGDMHVCVVGNELDVPNSLKTSSSIFIIKPQKVKPMRSLLTSCTIPSTESSLSHDSASFDCVSTVIDFTDLKNPQHGSTRLKVSSAPSSDLGTKEKPDSDAESLSSLVPESDAEIKNIFSETDSERLSSTEMVSCNLTSESSTRDTIRLPEDIKEECDLSNVDSQGISTNLSQNAATNSERKLMKQMKRKQKKDFADDGSDIIPTRAVYYYNCDTCTYRSKYKQGVLRHMKCHAQRSTTTQKEKSYVCELCGLQFESRYGMKLHVNGKHKKIFRFTCDVCHKGYNVLWSYKGHLASHHAKLKSKCDICGQEFTYKKSLVQHQRTAHIKKIVKCDKCPDSVFSSNESLREHTQTVHNDRRFSCHKCGKLYKWRSSLAYHRTNCNSVNVRS